MNTVPDGATANPWGSTAVGIITEIQQLKCHELLDFFTLTVQGGNVGQVDLEDSNFQVFLAGAQGAGVMSTTQETALLALANNSQTRAQELKLGRVFPLNVTEARAL